MGPCHGPWAHGPTSLGPIKKIIKIQPIWVAMPPHGLIFGGNEAHGLQDAFGSVPGREGPQKRDKNAKFDNKNIKNNTFVVFLPLFLP